MPTVSDRRLRLSGERSTIRWAFLALTWVLVAALALTETLAVRDYVSLLDDSGTLPTTRLALKRTLPAPYADAQQWTRLALEDSSGWQVRHTDTDDAPTGRDVHWNSAFVHLIQLAGRVDAALTHDPRPAATENALAWFNLPIFLAVVVFFSAWVTRRSGAAAGVLVALGMTGHRFFYDGFAPNYVDHHGLLNAAVFGVVLGALYMNAGWRDADAMGRRDARGAAILSAACGGVGLWISAASTIPAIALTGVGAVIAAWIDAPSDGAADVFDGALWRLWGRVGGAISVVAYLAEYAPHHLGMRLEVNHPLYALAWVGGGELIALFGEWRATRVRPPVWRVALASVAVAAAPIVILVWRAAVFLPLDPQLATLHAGINEFTSLYSFARHLGIGYLARYLASLALLLPALLVLRRRQPLRRGLALAAVVTLGLGAMGAMQVRWWLPASAAELCLLLVAIASLGHWVSRRAAVVAIAAVSAVFVQGAVWRVLVTRWNVDDKAVTMVDAMQPLFRDAAVALRASQPAGDITVLSSPDASEALGYFGGFRTIGTFYWENRDGLVAAARMFSAATDDEAHQLLAARGVTHVAVFSASNFLDPFVASQRGSSAPEVVRGTFGYRLLASDTWPRWLRPIPFIMRPDAPSRVVRLFQVVPEQTEFDALWTNAVARAASGDSSAHGDLLRAIAMQPPARKAELLATAGRDVYRWRAHALALRLYRESAAVAPSRSTTLAIAWLLATSVDDAVRDGRTAVAMMEPLARSIPYERGVLDTYAAALAEAGRFEDAVRAESAVVANAEQSGDEAARARGEMRLASYRNGRPWRQ